MALGDLFGGMFSNMFGGGLITLFVYMALGVFGIGAIGGLFAYLVYQRKKWFIKVEFKIPRSDGRIMNAEWGKGSYNARQGVVHVKRKGKKPVPMKPFDVKRYLQGNDLLTVVQIGIEDYRPVLPESFIEMIDDRTGEEAAYLKVKIDTSESKAWRQAFERDAKNAYSIATLFQQYAQYIGFGILFFMIFVGFAILWGRIR